MTEKKVTATATRTTNGDIEFRYSTGAIGFWNEARAIAAARALKELHRAEKAAKKVGRRFVPRMDGTGAWRVEDKDTDFELIAKFYNHGNEANAKAFAKLLNKQERKRLACNTVTPGTDES